MTTATEPTMDTERLRILADTLEKTKDSFTMTAWIEGTTVWATDPDDPPTRIVQTAEKCGTKACIAGYAVMLFADQQQIDDYYNGDASAAELAAKLLGLDEATADQLFTPESDDEDPQASLECSLTDISAYNAADTLRHLADYRSLHWFANCLCPECDIDRVIICSECTEA